MPRPKMTPALKIAALEDECASLRARLAAAEHTANECRRANQAQLDALVNADMTITHLRAQVKKFEAVSK